MGKIVLPYQLKQDRRGHWSQLPLAQIIVYGRTRSVPVSAVIDSGATHPFFPTSVAEDAGIELQPAQQLQVTFGGSESIGLLKEAYIALGSRRLKLEIVFVEDLRLGYALLGRHTVFPQFNEVSFLESTRIKRVELRY
jgi:hypothetical protein